MHRSRLRWRTKLAPSQPLRHDNPLHPTAYTSRISVQSYPAVDQASDATLVKTRRTRVGTRFRSKSGLRPNLTMPRPCALHPTSATHDTVSHTLSQELDRSNATRGTDAETVGLRLGSSTKCNCWVQGGSPRRVRGGAPRRNFEQNGCIFAQILMICCSIYH